MIIKRTTTYFQDENTSTEQLLERAKQDCTRSLELVMSAEVVSAWPVGAWWERSRGVEIEVTLEITG